MGGGGGEGGGGGGALISATPDVQMTQKNCERFAVRRTPTKRDLLFMCRAASDILYPTLSDKTYPAIIQAGLFCLQNASSGTLATRLLDPGVSLSFVSTDLCFFYPPSEPKTPDHPPPSPPPPPHKNKQISSFFLFF